VSRQLRHRVVVCLATLWLGLGTGTAACSQATPAHDSATATSSAPLPSSQASASPGTAPGAAAPATVTILGSGDVLLHPQLWDQARTDARARSETGYDFRPLFAGVRDVVSSADLAIFHMETPLADAAGPFSGYPRFSVPPQVVAALADLGYDSCSTASNHTIDQGEAGVDRTLDALDAAHIKHAGSYRSKAEHGTVNLINVHGVTVAHLSYAFGFNGLTRPAGKAWIANQIDTSTIQAEAKRARAKGASIVVVSLHFGTEYQHAPNAQQLPVVRTLLASPDVDLILGHHAHVVQPFERIGAKWVAYGMGNEVAHHGQPVNDNREGVLARFTFTEVSPGTWRVTRAEAIPIWMDLSPNNRLVDIATALANPATPASERSILRAAWLRIRGYLYMRGAGDAGLAVDGS
jgi:Bacterial capsule synthesis protein PGA_cap